MGREKNKKTSAPGAQLRFSDYLRNRSLFRRVPMYEWSSLELLPTPAGAPKEDPLESLYWQPQKVLWLAVQTKRILDSDTWILPFIKKESSPQDNYVDGRGVINHTILENSILMSLLDIDTICRLFSGFYLGFELSFSGLNKHWDILRESRSAEGDQYEIFNNTSFRLYDKMHSLKKATDAVRVIADSLMGAYIQDQRTSGGFNYVFRTTDERPMIEFASA